jgi:ribonuclease P protein component
MLPLKNRLKLPSDFYKLKKFGKRVSNNYFSVSYITNDLISNPEFSVIVSKLVAKKSNKRNKLKRKTKGLILRNFNKLPKNILCLVYPKVNSLSVKNKDLEVEFLKIFEQVR